MMRLGKMEGNAAPEEAACRPHSERRTCPPAHDSELSLLPATTTQNDLFCFACLCSGSKTFASFLCKLKKDFVSYSTVACSRNARMRVQKKKKENNNSDIELAAGWATDTLTD
jgi:hypothetical protein